MKNFIKLIGIFLILTAIIVLAGGNSAWAGWKSAPVAAVDAKAPLAAPTVETTVRTPFDKNATTNNQSDENCPLSIGGAAIFCQTEPNTDAFAYLEPQPEGFLSKVVYLEVTSGAVYLCFPAPTGTEKVYFQNNGAWEQVFTFYRNGMACTETNQTGRYVAGY